MSRHKPRNGHKEPDAADAAIHADILSQNKLLLRTVQDHYAQQDRIVESLTSLVQSQRKVVGMVGVISGACNALAQSNCQLATLCNTDKSRAILDDSRRHIQGLLDNITAADTPPVSPPTPARRPRSPSPPAPEKPNKVQKLTLADLVQPITPEGLEQIAACAAAGGK